MGLTISNKFYSPEVIKFNRIFQNDDDLLYARLWVCMYLPFTRSEIERSSSLIFQYKEIVIAGKNIFLKKVTYTWLLIY